MNSIKVKKYAHTECAQKGVFCGILVAAFLVLEAP